MKKQFRFIAIAAVITFTLIVCNNCSSDAADSGSSAEEVRKVDFSGPTEIVTLTGLKRNDIYLVKVNTSGYVVRAANTGGPSASSPKAASVNVLSEPNGAQFPRMGHPMADEFNANPPPIEREAPRLSRAVFVPPVVDNTRMFWVESYYNSRTFVQKQATLRATGQYGNIWVMDENYGTGGDNKITTSQAQALANKFDLIYPIETNLLGYEYGGGPGGNGGKDGDPKIQILVYDILDGDVSSLLGYFSSWDFYEQSNLDSWGRNLKTNLAEIFYLNARPINNAPDFMYSTLVHEFQHMINFNEKYVKRGKNSEAWYNEMLSMMAEDVISPLIGVSPTNWGHPRRWIDQFLSSYNQVGITEWNGNESYAKGYAFGAYLLRNYGGASLLKEMLANYSANIDSVSAALKKVAGIDFKEALRRYGEAMVFSGNNMPADVMSFDKTVAKTIGRYTYTATKFDIWKDFGSTKPRIFGLTEQLEMRPYSLTVHQDAAAWKNQTGDVNIALQRPNDTKVEFYLMVK